jgi:hypothetical protein
MKKYKIEVSGKGSEVMVFPLDDLQKTKLLNGDVEGEGMTSGEVLEVLEVEDFLDSEHILIGLYPNPNLLSIRVYDEGDIKIWESDDEFNLQSEDIEYLYEEPNTLVVEDYIKGTPFIYNLEIDEEFDPKHLEPIVVSVGEVIELMTDLKYNNVILSPFREFGDYWSKGLSFYLS